MKVGIDMTYYLNIVGKIRFCMQALFVGRTKDKNQKTVEFGKIIFLPFPSLPRNTK